VYVNISLAGGSCADQGKGNGAEQQVLGLIPWLKGAVSAPSPNSFHHCIWPGGHPQIKFKGTQKAPGAIPKHFISLNTLCQYGMLFTFHKALLPINVVSPSQRCALLTAGLL